MAATLVQFRIFVTAARLGSFSAAATTLELSQPTVSEAVRRLEQQYGLRLFFRGSRRLLLTPAGEDLLPRAEQTLESADAAETALRSIRALDGGSASFGLLRNARHYAMADLLTSFHDRHPGVRLRVVGTNSADVADLVRDGALEAGLVVLPVDAEGLVVTPLVRDEVVFATSDPHRGDEPVDLDELAAGDLILYDANAGWRDPTRRQLADRAQVRGLSLSARIEVEQADAALDLVAAGAGTTFVSRSIALSPLAPPNVRFLPFAEPLYDVVALIQRKDAALTPATRELVRLAREKLASTAGHLQRVDGR